APPVPPVAAPRARDARRSPRPRRAARRAPRTRDRRSPPRLGGPRDQGRRRLGRHRGRAPRRGRLADRAPPRGEAHLSRRVTPVGLGPPVPAPPQLSPSIDTFCVPSRWTM